MTKNSNNETILNLNHTTRKIIFFLGVITCITPIVSPAIALILGILYAQLIGHPYSDLNKKATSYLLKASVIGLGFGMNLTESIKTGKDGFLFTLISILCVLLLGFFIGKLFKVEKKTSYLISAGTAICGGSAIAAISPIIKAKENQISIAIGTVFILNSVALLIFPYIGSAIDLSQNQFGMWCAIAIHDTSSVVGAASKYGDEALKIATTVKLTRALWIIPLAFFSAFAFKSKDSKVKIPYFIGFFILAMIMNTYIPIIQEYNSSLIEIAKKGLTATLFLIGCGLNRNLIKSVGLKPLIQAIIVWMFILFASLWVVMNFYT